LVASTFLGSVRLRLRLTLSFQHDACYRKISGRPKWPGLGSFESALQNVLKFSENCCLNPSLLPVYGYFYIDVLNTPSPGYFGIPEIIRYISIASYTYKPYPAITLAGSRTSVEWGQGMKTQYSTLSGASCILGRQERYISSALPTYR
jgi:hypothetical protein